MEIYAKRNRIAYKNLGALTRLVETLSGYLVGFSDKDKSAYQEAIFYLSAAKVMAEDGRYEIAAKNIKRADKISPIDLKSHPKTEQLFEQFPDLVTLIDASK